MLATVIRTPDLLRVSSPDPAGLAALEETAVGRALAGARREKTPLPIAWADAALGTFRLPPGLDDAAKASLARSVVEHVYEDLWVHQPRRSLGDLAPLEAARRADRGDLVARARLAAVVRYREQLGTRPTHAEVYQGYPFDRLRRRLGLLTPDESDAFDAADASCMGERELDGLDPSTLDDHRLADAFRSAAALRDDARTARFAAALARRPAPARDRLDPAAVFAPLVRESLRTGDPEEALAWLTTAMTGADGPRVRVFTVWSAEIHARSGRPEAALRAYQELLDRPDSDGRPGPRRRGDPARQRLSRPRPSPAPRSPRPRPPVGRPPDGPGRAEALLGSRSSPDETFAAGTGVPGGRGCGTPQPTVSVERSRVRKRATLPPPRPGPSEYRTICSDLGST